MSGPRVAFFLSFRWLGYALGFAAELGVFNASKVGLL